MWFFWLVKAEGVHAGVTVGGYQEQTVLVKRGCTPEVIAVEAAR